MKKDKDRCPICGYDWLAHEFAVPAPYCPENDKDAEANRVSSDRLKKILRGEIKLTSLVSRKVN